MRLIPLAAAATLALAGSLAAPPAPAAAQFPDLFALPQIAPRVELDEARGEIRSQIDRVAEFLADGQYEEAVDTLRRAAESQPHVLVRAWPAPQSPAERPASPPVPGADHAVYLPLRAYAHLLLCRWQGEHPELLRAYRRRVDPLAARWLAEGLAARDPAPLVRLVDELFASTPGDDALLALGELELTRGRPAAARRYWEQLSPALRATNPDPAWRHVRPGAPWWMAAHVVGPAAAAEAIRSAPQPPSPPPFWPAYPDTDLDLAMVRARLAWASILEGSLHRAALEIDLLRRLHPQARGPWGGREVTYADELASLLEQATTWAAPPPPPWSTFAGTPQRDGRAPAGVDVGGGPLWEIDLGDPLRGRDKFDFGRTRVAEDRHALLSRHAVVSGQRLLLHTGTHLRVFNLSDGQPLWTTDGAIHQPRAGEFPEVPGRRGGAHTVGVPRHTLTVAGDVLLARCGDATTSAPGARDFLGQRGYIVALDLRRQGKLLPGFPLDVEDRSWAFEGTPVADGERLYVALRRGDTQAHVAAYELASGRLVWRRQVSAAENLARGDELLYTHGLLSLVDDTLYYNTQAGAVAALATDDGRLRWIASYPRAVSARTPSQMPWHWLRDLTPPLVHRGQVIVAAADCDHLFALDAATGAPLWEGTPGQGDDIVHLLGANDRHLLASGDYLYWIDLYTGQVAARFPETGQPASGGAKPSPAGYGRGLLAGDQVYWPTRQRVHVFQQSLAEGNRPLPARQPIDLASRGATGGHLLIVGDKLLVVGPRKVWAFAP